MDFDGHNFVIGDAGVLILVLDRIIHGATKVLARLCDVHAGSGGSLFEVTSASWSVGHLHFDLLLHESLLALLHGHHLVGIEHDLVYLARKVVGGEQDINIVRVEYELKIRTQVLKVHLWA